MGEKRESERVCALGVGLCWFKRLFVIKRLRVSAVENYEWVCERESEREIERKKKTCPA